MVRYAGLKPSKNQSIMFGKHMGKRNLRTNEFYCSQRIFTSMYFFALSHAPPVFDAEMAI
jgi:hypothetical protein